MTATEKAMDSILFTVGMVNKETEDVIVQLIKRHKREVINEFAKKLVRMGGGEAIDKIIEIAES